MDRRSVAVGIGSALLVGPPRALATPLSRGPLYFAGVSLLPRLDETQTRLPVASALLTDRLVSELNTSLVLAANGFSSPNFPRLVAEQLGQLRGRDEALCLTLALDREAAGIERHADLHRLSVELWAQALIFDFVSRQVVTSFPFVSRYNDVSQRGFADSAVSTAVKQILTGSQPSGLLGSFWNVLGVVSLPRSASRTLRVTEVAFSEMAAGQVRQLGRNPNDVAGVIAADFGSLLVSNQKVPVLPYGMGAAVGSTMAARFAENAVYQLTIPEPDYQIRIRIDGFRRVEAGRTELRVALVYGAFITIEFVEPLSGRVFFQSQLRRGVQRTVLADSQLNEWPSYYEAILGLFMDFTQRIGQRDRAWEREHIISRGEELSSLTALGEVIEKCR